MSHAPLPPPPNINMYILHNIHGELFMLTVKRVHISNVGFYRNNRPTNHCGLDILLLCEGNSPFSQFATPLDDSKLPLRASLGRVLCLYCAKSLVTRTPHSFLSKIIAYRTNRDESIATVFSRQSNLMQQNLKKIH